MTELTRDEYIDKLKYLIRKQLSLTSVTHRGLDNKSNLLFIDGRNDERLIPPQYILNLASTRLTYQSLIESLTRKLKAIAFEVVRTRHFSVFLKDKIDSIEEDLNNAIRLDAKIIQTLEKEKSGISSTVIALQKAENQARTEQEFLGDKKLAKYQAGIIDSDFRDTAAEYARKNSELLRISKSLDLLVLQNDQTDSFLVRRAAVSIMKPLNPDQIRVKIS